MKKILHLILLVGYGVLAQNTSLKVSYQQAIVDKKLTKSDEPRLLKGVEFQLLANDSVSEFRFVNKLLDSERGNLLFVAKAGVSELDIFYTNLKSKEDLTRTHVIDKEFLIDYPFNKYKWEITREEKKIGKYTCRKALGYYNELSPSGKTLNRQVVAWFTSEIPLSYGPKGFHGLPGLILEAQKGKYIFIAKEVQISQEEIKIHKPSSKNKVKEEQFIDYINKFIRRGK